MSACELCGLEAPDGELQPGPSGDPTCGDCLATFAGQDDAADWREHAHA